MGEQAALVKFGQREHILRLQHEGHLYMNNLPYFWNVEDEGLRGDPCDTVDELASGVQGKVLVNGNQLPLRISRWNVRIEPEHPERINLFCMYAMRPLSGSFPVNEKNLRFGDYSLVVTNVPEYFKRIEARLSADGIYGESNLVEYVDDDFEGQVGPFRKLRRFAYQSEWRLVCYDGPSGVRTISIGSIQDISFVLESANLNAEIKFGI